EGTGSKTSKKHPKNREYFYLSISIPLFFSRRFSALFKSSNSPLGDLPLTLSTKSLKTFLNAFIPSVRSFKNYLVLLYIVPISLVKSFTRAFNDVFSSSNSLLFLTFELNLSTRSLYLFLTTSFFLRKSLFSLAVSVFNTFFKCVFNFSLSLAAVTNFL